MDYAFVQPDWLEQHEKYAGKLCMSLHRYRTLTGAVPNDGGPPLTEFDRISVDAVPWDVAMDAIEHQRGRVDEISCFAEPFPASQLTRYPIEHVSCPETKTARSEPYWFSTKNESFPRCAIFGVNGMDEMYDLGRGPGDPDLGYRLSWVGLEPWIVMEAAIDCINPRRILPNMNLVIPEQGRLPPPYEHRWGVADGNKYYDMVRAMKRMSCPNPRSLVQLRDQIWHWRELSQQREACIG
jgi:hypothetical protein